MTCLEDLDICNTVLSAPAVVYVCPFCDDGQDVVQAEGRQTQIMPRVETHDIAAALDRLGGQQGMGGSRSGGSRWWQNRSVIVLEYHGGLVVLVDRSVRADIPRAEITVLVILGQIGRCGGLCLAQPRALRTVWRDEDVCVGEGIVCGG